MRLCRVTATSPIATTSTKLRRHPFTEAQCRSERLSAMPSSSISLTVADTQPRGSSLVPPPAEVEISLRDIFVVLQRHKKLIAAVALLVTAAALIHGFTAARHYSATATIEINGQTGPTLGAGRFIRKARSVHHPRANDHRPSDTAGPTCKSEYGISRDRPPQARQNARICHSCNA